MIIILILLALSILLGTVAVIGLGSSHNHKVSKKALSDELQILISVFYQAVDNAKLNEYYSAYRKDGVVYKNTKILVESDFHAGENDVCYLSVSGYKIKIENSLHDKLLKYINNKKDELLRAKAFADIGVALPKKEEPVVVVQTQSIEPDKKDDKKEVVNLFFNNIEEFNKELSKLQINKNS